MKLVTEDRDTMSVSILLSKRLAIEYAIKNSNIKGLIAGRNNLIVFYDCNPNNSALYEEYQNLSIYASSLDNVYVLPVVCTEYYVIKALVKQGYDFGFKYPWMSKVLECVLNKQNIYNMPPKIIGWNGTNKNFEQLCKVVLSNAKDEIHNIDTRTGKPEGSYFMVTDSAVINSRLLPICRELPCCVFNCELPYGFEYVNDIESIIEQLDKEYENWCNSVHTIKLKDKWWEDYK